MLASEPGSALADFGYVVLRPVSRANTLYAFPLPKIAPSRENNSEMVTAYDIARACAHTAGSGAGAGLARRVSISRVEVSAAVLGFAAGPGPCWRGKDTRAARSRTRRTTLQPSTGWAGTVTASPHTINPAAQARGCASDTRRSRPARCLSAAVIAFVAGPGSH